MSDPLNREDIIKLLSENKWNTDDNDSLKDIVNLVRAVEEAHGIVDDSVDEAQEALENIEQEIIARACRNGVCED